MRLGYKISAADDIYSMQTSLVHNEQASTKSDRFIRLNKNITIITSLPQRLSSRGSSAVGLVKEIIIIQSRADTKRNRVGRIDRKDTRGQI